ncbi:MAG: membrane protein insertion efficiency factor YidD [Pyrinomonadaceae bacterium]|nr:membrane protein insertion efficiency factor YidD [Pyrinomonadaceae bacterium]
MKFLVIEFLRLYKMWVSPFLPPACRFTPSCSTYAMEAVEKYGIFHGILKGFWRLLRCQPFCKGGHDPVI